MKRWPRSLPPVLAPSLPIEHHPQEEEVGCLAGCAQMVLADLGINISQTEFK